MKINIASLVLIGILAASMTGCQTPPPDVIVVNQLPEPAPAPKPRPTVTRTPAPPKKSDPTKIEPVKPPQTFSNF